METMLFCVNKNKKRTDAGDALRALRYLPYMLANKFAASP
mgnify:CR=1 FL=1